MQIVSFVDNLHETLFLEKISICCLMNQSREWLKLKKKGLKVDGYAVDLKAIKPPDSANDETAEIPEQNV